MENEAILAESEFPVAGSLWSGFASTAADEGKPRILRGGWRRGTCRQPFFQREPGAQQGPTPPTPHYLPGRVATAGKRKAFPLEERR